MSECCSRELTLEEVITALEIDDDVKKLILYKLKVIEEESKKKEEYLYNCHCEIDRLKKAIVSQAKMIGSLEEEISSK